MQRQLPAAAAAAVLTLIGRLWVVVWEGDKASQGQQAQRVLNLLALQATQAGRQAVDEVRMQRSWAVNSDSGR